MKVYVLLKKLEYFDINCFCIIYFLDLNFSKKDQDLSSGFMKGVKSNILICKLGHQTYPAHSYSSIQLKTKKKIMRGWMVLHP